MSWASLESDLGNLSRRFPALVLVLGAILGIGFASWAGWFWLAGLASVVFSLSAWWREPAIGGAALVALVFAALHGERLNRRDAAALELRREVDVAMKLTVEQQPRTFLIPSVGRLPSGAAVVLEGLPEWVTSGHEIELRGRPEYESKPRNPGIWSRQSELRKRGYAGVIWVNEARVVGKSFWAVRLRGWAERCASKLSESVTSGIAGEEEAALVTAAVLGQKSSGGGVFESFRRTGTMHVFTVSGLHVGLIGLLAWGVGRLLRLPPRVTVFFVLGLMASYTLVTGLKPAALRAFLMAFLCLLGPLFGRKTSVWNSLGWAALIVLLGDSFQLGQAGFQLSFLVVMVILALEPKIWEGLLPLIREDSYLPSVLWTRWQKGSFWVRKQVARLASVSAAAWCGSTPLSLAHFGWFVPVGVLASVVMVPLAFLILANALGSQVVACVSPPWSREVNRWNEGLAGMAIEVTSGLQTWPGAWTNFHRNAPWQDGILIFDLPYGGQAMHWDTGGGILVNGGTGSDYFEIISPCLRTFGAGFDSLISTHASVAFAGGLLDAVQEEGVAQLMVPHANEPLLSQLIDEAKGLGLSPIKGVRARYELSEPAYLEVLWPSTSVGRNDDEVLVYRLVWQGWRILVTGSAGAFVEGELLETGEDLKADVWVCGVNPTDWVGTSAFCEAVDPELVIVLDEKFPEDYRVAEDWCRTFEARGARVLRQSEWGAISMVPAKERLKVAGFFNQQRWELCKDKRESQ